MKAENELNENNATLFVDKRIYDWIFMENQ